MNNTWRQVRVFTSNVGATWYFELLHTVIMPWLAQAPETRYFFSKYLVPLGGGDDADTNEALLGQQTAYLQQTQQGQLHRSIRIRFIEPTLPARAASSPPARQAPEGSGGDRATPAPAAYLPGPTEMALRKLIQAHPERYWFSDFRGYAVEHDLGGDRFSIFAAADIEAREKRGELVASVLHANCQLVLNLFTVQGQSVQIEHSNHQFNAILGTPVQSVAHLLANVWFTSNGDTAEIWAMDTKRHIGMQA